MKTDAIRKYTIHPKANRLILLRFAIESRKESRLPDCLSYSVVKEPTPAKGAAKMPDPPVRVKRNVSVFTNSFRLARTACWKEQPLPAGTEELSRPVAACQPCFGNVSNRLTPHRISSFALFSRASPLRLLQRASTASGPGTTPHP